MTQKIKRSGNDLCFNCKKSGYGKKSECPWEREFKPVDGWTAEEAVIDRGKKYAGKSYRIISCPLYERQEKKEPTYTPQALANVKRLIQDELAQMHGRERETARRELYKKRGVCIKCANAFATVGYTMCQPCRIKHAARCRKERRE